MADAAERRSTTNPTTPLRTPTLVGDAPADSPGAMREVFLSPRIIDREAFDQFAGELRRLISEARAEGESLKSTNHEARTAQDELRQIATTSKPKLEAVAKALAALDEKANRVEHAAAQVSKVQTLTDAAPKIASEAVTSAMGGVEQKFDDFRTRLEGMIAGAEAAALARLERSNEFVAQAEARLEERIRRGEELLAQRWAAINAELNRLQEQAGSRLSSLDMQVQGQVDAAAARMQDLAKTTDERIVQSWTHANELVGRLTDAAARAERLLGNEGTIASSGEHGGDSARLTLAHVQAAVNDAKAAAVEARGKADEIRAIAEQASLARSLLGDAINDASARVDELAARAEGIAGALRDSMSACDAAQTALMKHQDDLRQLIAEPRRHIESAAEQIDGLGLQLAARIADARKQTRETCDDASMLLMRLQDFLAQLRPWTPLLIDTAKGDAPKPIREMVENVRSSLANDMSTLARTLSEMTAKAEAARSSLVNVSVTPAATPAPTPTIAGAMPPI